MEVMKIVKKQLCIIWMAKKNTNPKSSYGSLTSLRRLLNFQVF